MTDRKSKKQQRLEQLAKEKRRKQLLTWGPIAVVGIALLGLILFRVFEPDIEGVLNFGAQQRNHEVNAAFDTGNLPPTGGNHAGSWQTCGIYETPVDNGAAVHSLEHGAVWITYRPDLPREDIDVLQEKVRGKGYLLLSPYQDQETDVVVSAWSTQLVVDGVDDGRIDDFISQFRNQGPESAPCSGGIGSPLP